MSENSGVARVFARSTTESRLSEKSPIVIVESFRSDLRGWFGEMARKLLPVKTGAVLHYLTGRSERQCFTWAAGNAEPAASVLADLLRSDEGEGFLRHVMAGSKARWWRDHVKAKRKADLLDEHKRSIEQLNLDLE